MTHLTIKRIVAGVCVGFVASPAFAHPGHGLSGFSAGFAHPLLGWDHLLAMLAIGLWAAQQQRSLMWLLPALFPAVMVGGALAGLSGIHLPGMETGIAASVAVLGLLIAFAVRLSVSVSVAVVALFALFHGYAHGVELPQDGSFGTYGLGFILATVLLHASGLAIGRFAQAGKAATALRAVGAAMAFGGIYLLAGTV